MLEGAPLRFWGSLFLQLAVMTLTDPGDWVGKKVGSQPE